MIQNFVFLFSQRIGNAKLHPFSGESLLIHTNSIFKRYTLFILLNIRRNIVYLLQTVVYKTC